jgi:prephenate dehydrogenase
MVPATLAEAARCDIVVLAVPVSAIAQVVAAIAPELRPGALVLDVGSVKVGPARDMLDGLPAHVDILATHPLFGPQSAKNGIEGLHIAVCPLRGARGWRAAAFLRKILRLRVIVTTPDRHDRDAALSQGLTHLIARVLVQMEPLPRRISTRSFDLLFEAIGMVRDDPPAVFDAIERLNPYAADVRHHFMRLVAALNTDIDGSQVQATGSASRQRDPRLPALSDADRYVEA